MNAIFAAGNPLSFVTELNIRWPELVSQGLMFVILSVVMYYFVFKPVLKAADERRSRIEKGLGDAEAARIKLEESEKAASERIGEAAAEASRILAQTREDAKAVMEKASADAAEKAAEIIKNARAEIEAERARMKDGLKAEIAGLVVKTAEAVLKGALDDGARAKISAESAKRISGQDER